MSLPISDKTEKNLPVEFLRFEELPDSAWVNVTVVALVFGISVPSVWRLSASGAIPKPKKISEGCTRWNVGSMRQHLEVLA